MPSIPEPTYIDAEHRLVVCCQRCTQDGLPRPIAGARRGTADARSIIKETKAHVDRCHSDWHDELPLAISDAIGRINAGDTSTSVPGMIVLTRRNAPACPSRPAVAL